MKVSVCMITYNHEKFIAQAVESVMVQETNFDYELVIGEDCSTDRTREIVLALKKKYPDKIRLLLPTQNLGMNRNLAQTLKACTGQYVALLEGDDYWTAPRKLQKQTELLDAHPESSICFHNCLHLYEEQPDTPMEISFTNQSEISTLEDLVRWEGSLTISTCTAMFRNGLFGGFPDAFLSLGLGDLPLHVLNAQYGNIRYIDEVMAVYRKHIGGVWSHNDPIKSLKIHLETFSALNKFLNYKHDAIIGYRILMCHYGLMRLYRKAGDNHKSRTHARQCLTHGLLWSYPLLKLKVMLRLLLPKSVQS